MMKVITESVIPFTAQDGTSCVRVTGLENFLVYQIFDCGQCFRFDPVADTEYECEFGGVAYGKYIRIGQNSPDSIDIYNTTQEEYESLWRHYLALDCDYSEIRRDIAERFQRASGKRDSIMPTAMEYGSGIRILRQEPWEAVCSFIISQNNNIPRIKKIIAAMSEKYGKPIICGGHTYYSFPTPEALADAGEDGIFALRTGFRAKYIFDAASGILDGRLDLRAVAAAEADKARDMLCEVKGIGPKVAACALLFGFGRTEAFPVDVWIKRVLAKYYPEGLDIPALGEYAGVAQQYLFYYERYNG